MCINFDENEMEWRRDIDVRLFDNYEDSKENGKPNIRRISWEEYIEGDWRKEKGEGSSKCSHCGLDGGLHELYCENHRRYGE